MGVCMSCKCARPRPKYKMVVRKIFDTDDPKKRFRDLIKYAEFAPKKLPEMTRYLNKMLRTDLRGNNPIRVEKAVGAYKELLHKLPEHLKFYLENLVSAIQELHNENLGEYYIYAFQLIEILMPHTRTGCNDFGSLDPLIHQLCTSFKNTEINQDNLEVDRIKQKGLQALYCILQNHGDAERLLKKFPAIVATVFSLVQSIDRNVSFANLADHTPDVIDARSPSVIQPLPVSSTEMVRLNSKPSNTEMGREYSVPEAAELCVKELCKIVSVANCHFLLTPLLEFLGENQWETHDMCMTCMRKCIRGMKQNHEEILPHYTITAITNYLIKNKGMESKIQLRVVDVVYCILQETDRSDLPSTQGFVVLMSKISKKHGVSERRVSEVLARLQDCVKYICMDAEFHISDNTLACLFTHIKSAEKPGAKEFFLEVAIEVARVRGLWKDANVNIGRVVSSIMTHMLSTDVNIRSKCLTCLKLLLLPPPPRYDDPKLQTLLDSISKRDPSFLQDCNLLDIELRLLLYSCLLHILTQEMEPQMVIDFHHIFFILFCTHPDFDIMNQIPFLEHLQQCTKDQDPDSEISVCVHTLILACLRTDAGVLTNSLGYENCMKLETYLLSVQEQREKSGQGTPNIDISSNGFLTLNCTDSSEKPELEPITAIIDFKIVYDLLPKSDDYELFWDVKCHGLQFERWRKKVEQHEDIESDNEPDYLDGRTQSVYGADSSVDFFIEDNAQCPPLPCEVSPDTQGYTTAVDACMIQISHNDKRIMDIMTELNLQSNVHINPDGINTQIATTPEFMERRGSRENVSLYNDLRSRKSTMAINLEGDGVTQPRTFLYNIPCNPDKILNKSRTGDIMTVPLLESMLDIEDEMSRILGLEHFDITAECRDEVGFASIGPLDIHENDMLDTLENAFDLPRRQFPSPRMEQPPDSHTFNVNISEKTKHMYRAVKQIGQKAKQQSGKLVKMFKHDEKGEKDAGNQRKSLIKAKDQGIMFEEEDPVHVAEVHALSPSM